MWKCKLPLSNIEGLIMPSPGHFHIFVGDLPDEMTTDLLKSSFDKFGKIS